MDMTMRHQQSPLSPPRKQRGVLTVFTGIMILLLLTTMMIYAWRVGTFEQRTSAHEVRQKLALHVAESGIQHAKEFFLINSTLAASDRIDQLPDGTDGWLAPTTELRWQECSDAGLTEARGTHPCYAESDLTRRANSYYYFFNGTTELALGTDGMLPGTTEEVVVEALLCRLVVDFDLTPPVQGCGKDLADEVDDFHYMVTLLARGKSDCDGSTCRGEVLISEPIANFGVLSGGNGAGVPLTTRSTFPPSGNAEIIPNPNGGGIGVPVSVWFNSNTSCSSQAIVDPSSGAWATCEMHEWYETDEVPDDLECPGSCSCTFDEAISYTHGTEDIIGIDMDSDPDFPCNLFTFYFGIPKENFESIKSQATIIDDCSQLGPNSFGVYWATGASCNIAANTVIGSQHAPVMLISAASETRFNGGTKLFGVLYISDVEDPAAELVTTGNFTLYGAAIIDATMGAFNGTFQIVYVESVAQIVAGTGGMGSLAGGWTDFHRDWY